MIPLKELLKTYTSDLSPPRYVELYIVLSRTLLNKSHTKIGYCLGTPTHQLTIVEINLFLRSAFEFIAASVQKRDGDIAST